MTDEREQLLDVLIKHTPQAGHRDRRAHCWCGWASGKESHTSHLATKLAAHTEAAVDAAVEAAVEAAAVRVEDEASKSSYRDSSDFTEGILYAARVVRDGGDS